MLLKSDKLAEIIEHGIDDNNDPLAVLPQPNLDFLKTNIVGSLDLRLGRWFLTVRHTRHPILDIKDDKSIEYNEANLTRNYFIPFGKSFILHPGKFVLGATLEWLRIPTNIVCYVTGKSSWGRRGLIIETAQGVHPGFAGCLTLEMTNVGEIPIAIRPGMEICQLFFHETSKSEVTKKSSLSGHRRPTLGNIKLDDIAQKLNQANNSI